jgi:hypothetical protein
MDWDYFWEFSTINDTLEYFIGFFEERVNWELLCKNEHVKWNDRRVNLFEESIDFRILSNNKNLVCSEECIENYSKRWQWGYRGSGGKLTSYSVEGLSANPRLPLDIYFLKRISCLIDFRAFAYNPSLVFKRINNFHPDSYDDSKAVYNKTFEILSCFEDKWHMEGSYWEDDDFHGRANDSILDNPEIDWKHFLELKEELRKKNNLQISDSGDDLPF